MYAWEVTYNFDPDRWYEMQQAALDEQLRRGELDADELEEKRTELEQRYHDLVDRLDGSFRIPG